MSGKAKRREQDRRRLAYSAKLTKDRRFGRQGRWVMSLNGDVQRFELSTSVPERMRGMLFRKPDDRVHIEDGAGIRGSSEGGG